MALLASLACPIRLLYADPAQPYFPDARRRRRVELLPRGRLLAMPGGLHLHMQQPDAVAGAIHDFLMAR